MHDPAMLLRIEASEGKLTELLASTLSDKHLAAHADLSEIHPLAARPVSAILAALEDAGWRVNRTPGAISAIASQDTLSEDLAQAWDLFPLVLAVLGAAVSEQNASGYAHVFNVPLDGFDHVAYAHYRDVEGELTSDDFSQDEDEIREMDEAQAAEERIAREDGVAWPVSEDTPIVNAF